LFSIVHPQKPKELTLDEFIKFSFDNKANKSIIIYYYHNILEFRSVVKKIRLGFKDETIDKKGIFLPFSFTTLLNFLSQKAKR
jgi:hypothetical protein